MATWYLADLPKNVEKPNEVAARVEKGIEKTQKLIPMVAKQLGPDRRIVTIAAANASAIDSFITKKTVFSPIDRKGEVENAEGFKIDFSAKKEPQFSVWGEKIEEIMKEKE